MKLATMSPVVTFLAIVVAFAGSICAAEPPVLGIRDGVFTRDGEAFQLWGIRVASAAQTAEDTAHLLAQLDDYQRHGVNSFTVFYQGCSGGYSNPFSTDGREVDAGVQERMEQILRAAEERGMVVIVGIFYQRAAFPFEDREAVRQVVRTVAGKLKPHRHVILNIANEQNSYLWKASAGVWDFRIPETIIELCQVAKQADPARLVGSGGYKHENNEIIGRSPHVDVLLFDTKSTREDSGVLYERFRKAGVLDKPIVNVETFGAVTKDWLPQGYFPSDAKKAYLREVESAVRHSGLSIFFHSNAWCQGPAQKLPRRYDLAGQGTKDDPGIRWYFEHLRGELGARQSR
jgi:hypothetical protein